MKRVTQPRKGQPVDAPCMICKRQPREGEVYGSHDTAWDFTDICPECWDRMFAEEDDEEAAADGSRARSRRS